MRQTVNYLPPQNMFYFVPLEKLNQKRWEDDAIFLDPCDFYVPVQRANIIEVVEKEIHKDAIPKRALKYLPATSPRGLSSREERE